MGAADHMRGFLRDLRRHGLPVPIPKQQDFLRAIALLPPRDVSHLYWIARTTLTTSSRDPEIFDPVFDLWFRGGPGVSEVDAGEQPAPDTGGHCVDPPDRAVGEGSGLAASASRLNRRASFARTPDEERRILAQLSRIVPAAVPVVRSRRRRPARRGDRLDVREVHRAAWRSGGEIVSLRWRRRFERQRPVLVLIDISGSMKQHSPDYLRFAHAVVGTCSRAEVFTFGTTLTHVTKALRARDVDAALAGLADVVRDADGGTRIGPSLQEFLGNARHLRMARGALILVLSDGLERGDCVPLTTAVRRLSMLGHRLVWWSPLACDPAYRPITRGMAAVVGHVDALGGVRDLETARDQLLRGTHAWT
ncbi:uncharacterized protein with von Willebrand factor type A (vWA) domain [Kibdelosporangium banguiense]|uniref:Uncharacterized protein with von Willebrand factor type A (VWA) domain n=1 Tax=Kibdelosporangium banguiense TaxID=1365924 RepID=A0ABS4TTS2_9PSEU|nr:VWA domain-containing protein [Kibdelosporangium banguiense]MBP2327778.1 uncharacterized protein with von Willebrand factor type A (vWA) domain [Kibdelosporangium banguiense]